jgi:hypothetical protein
MLPRVFLSSDIASVNALHARGGGGGSDGGGRGGFLLAGASGMVFADPIVVQGM